MLLHFDMQHNIVVDVLNKTAGNLKDDELFKEIGEHLTNTTQERFRTSTAPDGSKWQLNSSFTLWLGLEDKHFNKNGTVNKRGKHRFNSKKPLIGFGETSGTLQDSIHYQLGNGEVFVGSNLIYAPMMHYGGTKAQFPHLWGDIPARPFIGLSLADEQEIIELVKEHILP